jgi:hypothetical protein
MSDLKAGLVAIMFATAGLWCGGCASSDINPERAHAGVGYVDFYCREKPALAWDVRKFTPEAVTKVFYDPDPVDAGILRLSFAPGTYRFRVSFLNQVISDPGEVELEIKEGLITPVQARLVPTGIAMIKGKSVQGGGTYYGRYGRTTKIRMEGADMFAVDLAAEPPIAYSRKAQMLYAQVTRP